MDYSTGAAVVASVLTSVGYKYWVSNAITFYPSVAANDGGGLIVPEGKEFKDGPSRDMMDLSVNEDISFDDTDFDTSSADSFVSAEGEVENVENCSVNPSSRSRRQVQFCSSGTDADTDIGMEPIGKRLRSSHVQMPAPNENGMEQPAKSTLRKSVRLKEREEAGPSKVSGADVKSSKINFTSNAVRAQTPKAGEIRHPKYRHIMVEQNGDQTTYRCTGKGARCGKQFTTRAHCRYHKFCTTKTFKCQDCEKSYCNDRMLGYHRKHHHNNGDKQVHVCDKCGKSFLTDELLKRHLSRHINKKTYICSACKLTFTSKTGVYSHYRVTHLNIRETCPKCGLKLSSKYTLKVHMQKKHAEC